MDNFFKFALGLLAGRDAQEVLNEIQDEGKDKPDEKEQIEQK